MTKFSVLQGLKLARRAIRSYMTNRPLVVSYEVTLSCNCNCRHCDLGGVIKDEKQLQPHEYGELTRLLNPPVVQISGGEPLLRKDILSIVAGASLATLSDGLTYPHIIRAMPNMPAQIGEGMIVWTTTTEVNQEHKKMARSILSALGKEIYFPEEKYIDMATALSGGGPAYVFLFIEVLTDAGVHIGLSHKVAKELAIQTTLGSAHMVEKVGKHPAELRNMVTSPGGTTAEALAQLEWGGLSVQYSSRCYCYS